MPEPSEWEREQPLANPPLDSLVPAALAIAVLQVFRADHQASLRLLAIDAAVSILAPLVAVAYLRYRSRISHADPAAGRTFLRCLLVVMLLTIGSQGILRSLGAGDSNEVVMLLVLQSWAWFTALCSWRSGCRQVSFLLSSAVVLFASLATTQATVFYLATAFAVVAMWWLMGSDWRRLKGNMLRAEKANHEQTRWGLLALLAVVICGPVLLLQQRSDSSVSNAIKGFMPTSGGNLWTDAFARSGLGDGDMLVAGEDATTTGAADSNQFIEDEKPSIYDMMSDQYDSPVFKKQRRNKAVALSELAKHIDQLKQSEQAGKTFRTVRKPRKTAQRRDHEDRITDALFFVEGSLPARFGLATYNHFDGWDWSNSEVPREQQRSPAIGLREIQGKPWFSLNNQVRSFLAQSREHKIKMMRLDTNTLPSPSFLQRWHIHRVNLPNLFRWGDVDLVQMRGECIPSQTVIDTISGVPNNDVLRRSRANRIQTSLPLVNLNIPEDSARSQIEGIARQWTVGIPRGFQQVEAITENLRSIYKLDPENVPPADCENSVGHFLETGSGPSYLFATTAVQLLRAAGYEARLTSGFLVQHQDYVATARQSIVTGENLHTWPEVRLEGWHWVPVEPTPGFPLPYNKRPIWQTLQSWVLAMGSNIAQRPLLSAVITLMFFGLIVWRAEVAAAVLWHGWWLRFWLIPSRRVTATKKLLDARFRVAGLTRPDHASLGEWFERVGVDTGNRFLTCWQINSFSSRSANQLDDNEVKLACQEVVAQLSFARLKQIASAASNPSSPSGPSPIRSAPI